MSSGAVWLGDPWPLDDPVGAEVAVMIPVWRLRNEAESLVRGLLQEPTRRSHEILVCHTVEAGDEARPFPIRHDRLRQVFTRKAEFSHARVRNAALLISRSPYLAYLSQDVRPEPDWSDRLVDALMADPRRAGACSRLVLPRDATRPMRTDAAGDGTYAEDDLEMIPELLAAAQSGSQQRAALRFHNVASCVRRDVLESIPFPDMPFGEDMAWALTVIQRGWHLAYVAEARAVHGHRHIPAERAGRLRVDRAMTRRLFGYRQHPTIAHAAASGLRAWWRDGRGTLRYRMAGVADTLLEPLRPTGRHRVRPLLPGKPKLLAVVPGLPPQSRGGTENFAFDLARASSDAFSVTVLCADGIDAEEEVRDGIRLIRWPRELRVGDALESIDHPERALRFGHVLDRCRPDLVHFHHYLRFSLTCGRECVARDIPYVVTVHDFWPVCGNGRMLWPWGERSHQERSGLIDAAAATEHPILGRTIVRAGPVLELPLRSVGLGRWPARNPVSLLLRRHALVREFLLNAAAVLVPSRTVFDAVRQAFPELERLHRVSLGLRRAGPARAALEDTRVEECHEHSRSERCTLRAGFLGGVVPHKGLDVARRAVRGLAPDVELHVFAPPAAVQASRDAGAAPEPELVCRGVFGPDDLGQVYGSLDVLLVPSLWPENQPLSILEAFAHGVPVLASDLGGMSELVRHGIDGMLLPCGDVEAWRGALVELQSDPHLLRHLRAATRRPRAIGECAAEYGLFYRAALSVGY